MYICTYTCCAGVARGWRGGELLPSGRGELQKSDRNCRLRNAIASATSRCDGGSPLLSSLSLSLSLLLLKCFCFAQNGPAFRLPIPRARFLAGSFRIFRISFSISRRVADNARVNGSLIIRSGCLLNYPAVRYSRPDGPAATSKSEKPLCGICIPDART